MERSSAKRKAGWAQRLQAQAVEHEAGDRPEQAVDSWAELAGRLRGPERAAALVRQAGVVANFLDQPGNAIALYRRALANDPSDPEALDALGEHAASKEEWPLLALVQARRYELAEDSVRQADIALALAQIEGQQLYNPGGARAWIERGLALAPGNAALHEALSKLERDRGDDAALLGCLERVIELRADETSPDMLFEAASLLAERGEPGRALPYFQRAAALAPDDASILDGLAEVLKRLERPTDLADVLERRAALAVADPELQASVLAELGSLLETRLFDPEAALDAFERAHAARPETVDVAAALDRLRAKLDDDMGVAESSVAEEGEDARAEPDPNAALRAYEREALVTNDRQRLGGLVREIEQLHARLGTPQEALPWVQRWLVAAPEDPEALRSLARLHERSGQEAQLAATLEALDRMLEPSEQLSNRLEIASLYASLERMDEAEHAYASALLLDPGHIAALEGRLEMLRKLGRTHDLIETLQRITDGQASARSASTLQELADLQEQVGDLAATIDTLGRLERDGAGEVEVADRLELLLERTHRYEELVARLDERAARYDEGSAEAVALELRRAQILFDPLERTEEAADAFRGVLEHAPESPEARSGLERALRASIDASGLADFLSDQAETADDPETRDRFAFERAVLLEDLLERPEDALAEFRALSRSGSVPELVRDASRRSERLLERLGLWTELRDHLGERLGRHAAEEDVRIHERLARLCADRLDDDAGELFHLEQVVAQCPERAEIWQILASRYEQDGRIEDWSAALEAELATGPDHGRELTLRGRLAELCLGVLAAPERVRGHYERVFELNPAHNAAAQYLIEQYENEGRYDDVIRVLEGRLASFDNGLGDDAHGPSRRTALRLQIAHVREAHLDDLEGSISALEVALGEIGADAVVAEPLAAAYQRAGYALDLIDLCGRAAAACLEPNEQANWFVRLGDALLSRGQTRDAAEAYRKALSDRQDDRAVQASLRELYRELGESDALVQLLEAELDHLAGTAEIPVRLELADLLTSSPDRGDAALLHERRVLELDPHHPVAFERALALVERLGRPEEGIPILDARIRAARNPIEAVECRIRRARLLATPLGRPEDAIAEYRTALEVVPGRRDVRRELAQLLERQKHWSELLECWEWEARESEGAARIGWLEKAAAVAGDRISPEAALPWLARMRRERPDDASLVARVADIHRDRGEREALLHALHQQSTLTSDRAERLRCLLERAAILREHGMLGRALAALEPAGPVVEVLRERETMQRDLGLDAERAETLEALIATAGADLNLHRELANLYSDDLSEPDQAVGHWEAALALAPAGGSARIEILGALAVIEDRIGRPERWARYTEEELAALEPTPVFDDRRRELRCSLAITYDETLSRPDAALAHLRALLDAGDAELLGRETRDQLEKICLRLLRAEGNAGELETRLARRVERGDAEAALWLELGAIREEKLRASAGALDAYRATLELEPENIDALRGFRRTAERLGRWNDVADALERELDHPSVEDGAERGALFRALGDLYWHRIQSTTRASRCYAAALEANGADFAALRALQRLLEAMEDWRGALDLYESEVGMLGDANPQRSREIWLHVAELARDRVDDVERARRALCNAGEIENLETRHMADLAALHERAGDRSAFADSFARWCDAPTSGAGCRDHLRLAEALEELGDRDAAIERIGMALAIDDSHADCWDAAARLRADTDDPTGSAEALRRAAERVGDSDAARRLGEAAALLEPENPPGALELLRTAAGRDPDAGPIHAARTRIAFSLGNAEEAEAAAIQALDLGEREDVPVAELAEVARLGGDAAREQERLEVAAGLYARSLALEPRGLEAAAAYAETLIALGDFVNARSVLEMRLADAGPYAERAQHRAMLGACVEAAGEREEALVHYEAALEDDPTHPDALEATVRVYESLEQLDRGVSALERWSRATDDAPLRARHLLRAARWELRTGEHQAAAERHLREAVSADPELTPAWIVLVSLLLEAGRLDETIEAADRAASAETDPTDFGTLANLQGRAYEQRGARHEAADAFGIAAECDPRCSEAALAQARLLRGFGEWQAAATALATFAERHPGDDTADLAELYEQLGRLRAGPLEDVDGAVLSYRRAVELAPDRTDARAALAELLSHRPGDWDEALSHHRAVLAVEPTHTGCLRVALRIARGGGDESLVATGAAILRALGAATAYEKESDSTAAARLVTGDAKLANPTYETLRLLACEASREIATTLETSDTGPSEAATDDLEAAFRTRVLAAQGELTAPALLTLSPREVAETLRLIVALVLEPEQVRGDGRQVNALSSALGRRQRRKLRKLLGDATPADFDAIDFDDWHAEVRALAAAEALRDSDSDLRTALVAIVRDTNEGLDADIGPDAHLVPLLEADPISRAFLRRIVADWLGRL